MQQNFLIKSLDLSTYVHESKLFEGGKDLFKEHIYDFYRSNRRDFIWRNTTNPYHIVVSEIMLQQTQTDRVKEKFVLFIETFPTFEALAAASVRDVLAAWSGLGYNRRALALYKLAQQVVSEYNGILPADPQILVTFPGIGKNTAGSVCAFAFNMPIVFIETNIRAVYIHTFFNTQVDVHDQLLIPLIEQTLDTHNPREWYYALMDYGVFLKKLYKNPSRKSAHHTQQSRFEGSERQIRGMILKLLTQYKALTLELLCSFIDRDPTRIEKNLRDLCAEGFVKSSNGYFYL